MSGTSSGPGSPGSEPTPAARLPQVHDEAASVSPKDRLKDLAHAAIRPATALLVRAGVRADQLTVLGLILSLVAALLFFEGSFRWGALMVAIAGLFDVLDGEVARHSGRVSHFGAFLDSTLDRVADAAVLVGIAGFYLVHLMELVVTPSQAVAEIGRGLEPRTWAVVSLTAMLALVGSFMVSYTRARAEGLGLECKVGWFERPERMVLLIVAGAFGVGPVMPGALILLAILSFATAIQRVAHVWKNTRPPGPPAAWGGTGAGSGSIGRL